jgi:hypothetical protein
MAKLNTSFLGSISGTLGDVTFYKLGNKNFIRRRMVINKSKLTVRQMANRDRFKNIQRIATGMKAIYPKTLANVQLRMNRANLFIKLNSLIISISPEINFQSEYKEWVSYTMTIDYSKLVLSSGTLETPFNPRYRLRRNALYVLDIRWSYGNSFLGNGNDIIYLIAYCPSQNFSIHTFIERKHQTLSIIFPPSFNNNAVHVYMCAGDKNLKRFSDTLYIGSVFLNKESLPLLLENKEAMTEYQTQWLTTQDSSNGSAICILSNSDFSN